MCHQKGDFFVRKKVLSLLLAFCMIVAPFTVVQVAAETTQVLDSNHLHSAVDAAEDGDVIQLGADIAVTDSLRFDGDGTVTLDLNGHTLSMDGSQLKKAGVLINVVAGSVIVDDTKGNGQILANETYTGKAGETAHTLRCVQVCGGAEFTLRDGTLENTNKDFNATQTISNYGTVNVESGTIKGVTGIFCFAPVLGSPAWSNQQAVCNISGGEILGTPAESYQGEPKDGYVGASYGVALYGPGYTTSGVDNDAVILNMDGGVIRAMQGIGTNASSGKYAGFTINMTNGLIDGTEKGTGMYLPAMGVTNISGGEVTGAQGIRICAGELNMTSGTLTGTALSDNSDLVAGGSGGTNGALVAGKASNGYVGNIDISISGDAVIRNTASGSGVQPTIVVSDKNMASTASQEIKDKNGDTISNYSYSGTSISVSVDGAEIDGDVVKISNLTQNTTLDGGSTTLQLNNAAVSGDVINQTSGTSLGISGGSISGDVKNTNKGSVSVMNAAVSGSIANQGEGSILVTDSTVGGNVTNQNTDNGKVTLIGTTVGGTATDSGIISIESPNDNEITSSNGKTYTDLATALSELPAGGTLYLGKGTFAASGINQFLIDADQSNVTIRGQGDATVIDTGSYSVYGQAGFFVGADNVTIENLKIVSTSADPNVSAIKFSYGNTPYRVLNGGTLRNVTLSSDLGHGVNVHGVDGMLIDGVIVEKAGKLSISVANSPEVTVQNTTTATGGWGSDIGIMYTEGGEAYKNVSHVILGDGNTLSNGGVFYSEYTGDTIGSSQGQFSFEGDDNMVYRFPEKNEKGQYVYTTTVPRAALLREGQDPLYYGELNEKNLIDALADAQDGDVIEVAGDPPAGSHTITVDKAVTIRGTDNSAIIGDLIIAADGVKIEHTNLSEAAVQVTDGISTADLSYNYWGGEPVELDGVEVYPYYDSPEMGQDDLVEEPGNKPSGGGSSSDDSSVGSPLPTVPTDPGDPTDPTDPSTPSGFVSDTTNDLTVSGTYQFRITSLDGTIPFLTADNANFRVEFASQEGNDFFFKIHAQGTAGSTTVVSVNGVRLLTATVGGSAAGVISDTTAPFTVKKGETYQFRLTASARPSFASGSASFTVEYAGQIGSDYFYKVYAAGNVGDGCGFYINGEASPVAVATIA